MFWSLVLKTRRIGIDSIGFVTKIYMTFVTNIIGWYLTNTWAFKKVFKVCKVYKVSNVYNIYHVASVYIVYTYNLHKNTKYGSMKMTENASDQWCIKPA